MLDNGNIDMGAAKDRESSAKQVEALGCRRPQGRQNASPSCVSYRIAYSRRDVIAILPNVSRMDEQDRARHDCGASLEH